MILIEGLGIGVGLIFDVFKEAVSSKTYAVLHAGLALLGSALVILDALGGDDRVWINIGLAVVCYLILAAFAFNLA